jgi:tyrosine-protein phosphatase YwqE
VGVDIFEQLDWRKIIPLEEGSSLLLECHHSDVPSGFDDFMKRSMESGHRAILAHPAKNLAIQHAPEYVHKLLALFKPWEVLIRLTADSLSGAAGSQTLTCLKTLLKHNLAH